MNTGCLRRAALGCGGLLLVFLLAALFAWQLFPKDFFAGLPERLLNRALPGYQWRVAVAHCAWPGVIRLEGLEATPPGISENIRLDSLELRPDWNTLLRSRRKQGSFTARLAGGVAAGRVILTGDAGIRTVNLSTELRDIELTALPWAARMLGRDVRGRINGALATTLDAPSGSVSGLRAELTAQDGEIPLRNPVLGHERLPFAAVSARFEQAAGQGGALRLLDGTLQSPLGRGNFAGTLSPARPLAAARIDISGILRPGPELFAHVQDEPEFQALRLGLGGGNLSVTLSGTLADPALAFGPAPKAPEPEP